MSCPRKDRCPLFPLFTLKASLRTWQLSYCEADYTRCARFELVSAGKSVPANLLPSGKMLPMVGKHVEP